MRGANCTHHSLTCGLRITQAQKSRLSQRLHAASSPDFAADLRSSPDIDMSLVRGFAVRDELRPLHTMRGSASSHGCVQQP